MMDNILRSGYDFTEHEYELKMKYMMAVSVLILTAILAAIMTGIFYFLNDAINMQIFFSVTLVSICGIYIHRISGKKHYGKVVYVLSIFYFILIVFGYYSSPETQAISAWIIIQIISSLLLLNITMAVWITFFFSLFMVWMSFITDQSISYIILRVSPVFLALLYIYIVNKKFQMNIHLLEESNILLETRVKDRTFELEQEKNKLDYYAHHDDLTKLPNRLYLKKELLSRLTNGNELSIFLIDLDRFKHINDIYGHGLGDKVLCEIAYRLGALVSKDDFLVRMGGDEFIFLTNSHIKEEQEAKASSIINIIEKPIYIDNKTIYLSASVGIYLNKNIYDSSEEMISFADMAMFEAKKKGKGCYMFYSEKMIKYIENKVNLESAMKQAFKDDTLVLYYQPQVNIKTNTVNAIEILVRWNHPTEGFLYPDAFIETIEEVGLIVSLDYHILGKGMKQIVRWLKEGYSVPRMSFNISGQHVQKDFYVYLKNLLEITGCPPKYIELEITENDLIHNLEDSIRIFKQLQALDIHISIDDFGKGYSSLSYLKLLPINKIKIDKSFIRGIDSSDVDATIVKSVIQIAQSLKIDVVSEGVETQKEKDFLLAEGCKYMQGYYAHKPMNKAQLEEVMTKSV